MTIETDHRWWPMNQMPVGDQRNLVVELLGPDGRQAHGYWSGRAWSKGPVSDRPEPLGFEPILHRCVREAAPATVEPRLPLDAADPHVRLRLRCLELAIAAPAVAGEAATGRAADFERYLREGEVE